MIRRIPGVRRHRRLALAACTVALTFGLCFGDPAPAAAQEAPSTSKLDPRLRCLKSTWEEATARRIQPRAFKTMSKPMFSDLRLMGAGGRLGVDCLVLTDESGRQALEQLGLSIRTWTGRMATVTVPVDDLEILEDVPGIQTVEMSRPLKPCLNVSGPLVHATDAHGATQPPYPGGGYTGRNVVIGTVDTGIDVTHEDFRNGAGLTRIERLWDQTTGDLPAPAPYNYGTEYVAADINAGSVGETDDDGHGTHVMGIAAGDGSATGNAEPAYQYVGVAPDAPLIVVKTDFTIGGVADAVSYIFSKAGVRDAVINLSLGTQDGPHDGTSAFDLGLGGMTGPGRIIVAAAGNEAGSGIHARQSLAGAVGDSVVFTMNVPVYSPNGGTLNDFFVLDGWYEGTESISFFVETPNGRRSHEIVVGGKSESCLPTSGGDGHLYIENALSANVNMDREFYVFVHDSPISPTTCGPPRSGLWKIIARRKTFHASSSPIDIWIANGQLGSAGAYPEFVQGVSNDYLVGSPASAPGVISVGAFISKRMWNSVIGGRQYSGLTDADLGNIAGFSSPGPLRTGEVAPIISAPGMGIASSRSASVPADPSTNPFLLSDTRHMINQGTSQAAPHVAGAVALILERSPHEDPATIIHRLTNSAVHDAFTGSEPNNLYGYGKLDAQAAIGSGRPPITLASFEALAIEGGVRLQWAVGEGQPVLTFHVTRADTPAGPFTRITTEPLTGGPDYSYDDTSLEPGRDYWYQVEAIEVDGSLTRFGPYRATPGVPRFFLAQNQPNPFAGRTVIGYSLPAGGPALLRIFDLSGRLVRSLLNGPAPAGTQEVEWDGRNDLGQPVGSGLYFYRLETAAGAFHRKMILNR